MTEERNPNWKAIGAKAKRGARSAVHHTKRAAIATKKAAGEFAEGWRETNPRLNPPSFVKTKRDERLWEAAKKSADVQGRAGDWAYVMGTFQRMKQRTGGGELRENPGELLIVNGEEPDSEQAEAVFEMWHQKNPHSAFGLDTGCDGDDEMVCVGRAFDIVYRSGKWEKGRKTNDYVHTFDSKPKVWMLGHLVEDGMKSSGNKTVESLLKRTKNADGQFAVAELASPLSFTLDDGTNEGCDVAIHTGSKVYGAIDQRTILICDPHWSLIVIQGGEMHFDERGIVK